MSLAHFQVTSHTIASQHFREYPNATKDETVVLQLAVKEYRPLNNLDPVPGSATIIALHANGFPKETYEPLWDELVQSSMSLKIRAIWISDCSHQGASGIMNEDQQGDDPSWFDHSRDLLHIVNEFRDRIIQPIIGIGHSMGAAQLVHLSLLHPRLLYGLALIEPVIQDVGPVTLTTTKHQEAWSYTRANFAPLPVDRSDYKEHLMSPELDPTAEGSYVFVRAETILTFRRLPELRPSVLWVYGARSPVNSPSLCSDKMKTTGIGSGGSGGAPQGKVKQVVLQDTGHMVPFEKVSECADVISGWVANVLDSYRAEKEFHSKHASGKSEKDMMVLSKQWLEAVRLKANIGRPAAKANL